MALIVEDGSGKTDSEAYASVAEADTYHAARGNTAWADATTAEKEQALRLGADFLHLMYGDRWVERRTHDEQALDWPRAWVQDRDGFAVGSDEIPVPVKRANMEAALAALSEDLLADLDTATGIIREKLVAGPVEIETEYAGSAIFQKMYTKVAAYVREYIIPTNKVTRG